MNPSLLSLQREREDTFTFEDNAKGRIIGQGNIGNDTSSLIESVLFVDGLKHNLLIISQLCDKGFKVIFKASHCIIKDIQNDETIFMGNRYDNVYAINISKYDDHDRCFSSMHDQSWLWHKRLGHANMDLISQLNKDELVKGLPKINFQKDKVCETCQMGKQIKNSIKNKISFQHLSLLNYCIRIYLVPLGHQALEENLMHMLLWMTSLDTHGSCF